jgi:hypothetical protein
MDQAPHGGDPAVARAARALAPPLPGGGGLVYGRMRDGSGPIGLENGSPIGGLG